MTRREAREAVFGLLFESEFHNNESPETIYSISAENREIPEDLYIRGVYFGVMEHLPELDASIEKHAKGWTIARMSRVSRTVLRLAVYEMTYMRESVPMRVSINEAIELSKKFDSEKARGFINGILNAVKNDLLAATAEASAPAAETATEAPAEPKEEA